jgi:hypothetical protein
LLLFTYAYSQCCHGPHIERKTRGRRDRRKGKKREKERNAKREAKIKRKKEIERKRTNGNEGFTWVLMAMVVVVLLPLLSLLP